MTHDDSTSVAAHDDSSDTRAIEQLPSGRWRVRIRDTTREERPWMPSPVFEALADARAYRDGVRTMLDAHRRTTAPAEAKSLADYADDYLRRRELDGARSIETWRSQWRAHFAGTPIAARTLAEITTDDVRAWVEVMAAKKALVASPSGHTQSSRRLSRDTVSKVLVLLRGILEDARERGHVRTNVARDVRVKARRGDSTSDAWTFLTTAEIERLRASTDIPEHYKLVYVVAIYTGLREGELWGLHWRDVTLDGDRPEIVVRASRRGPTKSGKIRHVPLFGAAREALRRLRELAKGRADGLVFPTRTGEMRSKGDDARWADYFAPKIIDGRRVNVRCPGQSAKLGLGRRVRFHDLRHTCASHLVMGSWGAQWSLSEIAAFLGHSTTEITERYAHLSPDHLHRKAAATAVVTPANPRRGTAADVPCDRGTRVEPLARPRGLEPLTPRSVVAREPQSDRALTRERGTVMEPARALLLSAAQGTVSSAGIDALLSAVEGVPLVAAARALRTARPELRVALALRLAVEAVSYASADNADNADSADKAAL